ncbi:hypothetical protein AS034_13745 [[Bacillus] enclensis]|uniref:DUF1572 domain-containing protein n=1 Tax=[Bacillus] enclensis TaxID=1402860 RepID=A0A0V8HH93_9BACI|nr:DUF1572 family protein [[Bacillus] enclensis]KSU61885.1 hypothetical protein AS034_13745 [[Bacillus] enclensis]SCC16668.1 Protein of unknown function [[Bacillus] enclensis]
MSLGNEYIRVILKRFRSVKRLGDKTLEQLSEEETFWTDNSASNSAAIIVKHMSGNMVSRWTDFLTADGEKDYRNRDGEFQNDLSLKSEVAIVWENGWQTLMDALEELTEQDLLKTVTIRGERHLVLDAIERQLAHYSYHVGQLVYIGKLLKNERWESLSIPKGKSEEFLREMLKKHGK